MYYPQIRGNMSLMNEIRRSVENGVDTMNIQKIRFIEPGNLPYRASPKNLYTYEKYIRTPSHGLLTLATIAKEHVDDTLMYSESISKIR